MKTTYTLREGNECLLLTAADNGETKYCEEFLNPQDCGECLAMLQDGMTAEALEGRTNTFFNAEEAAEKIAEYDGLPVIADEKGIYPVRSARTGEEALESAARHRDLKRPWENLVCAHGIDAACDILDELTAARMQQEHPEYDELDPQDKHILWQQYSQKFTGDKANELLRENGYK